MKVGYIRVSTDEQIIDLQRDELRARGCEKIFVEKESGAKSDRPILEEAISFCREGDLFMVWKLDRLSRSLSDLIALVERLREKAIQFQSITEALDTTTPNGILIFHIFGAITEFERQLIRERTRARAGLTAARARGKLGGRPRKMNDKRIAAARAMVEKEIDTKTICESLGISQATFYRYLYIKSL